MGKCALISGHVMIKMMQSNKNVIKIVEENYKIEDKQKYTEEERDMAYFANCLEARIECIKELMFTYPAHEFQRIEHEEIMQKERRGEREFDYKSSILKFIKNIYDFDKEMKKKAMDAIAYNLRYKREGIYVINGGNSLVLFDDFAENPIKYLDIFAHAN